MNCEVALNLYSETNFPIRNHQETNYRLDASSILKKKKILQSGNSCSQLMLLDKIQKMQSSGVKLLIHKKPRESCFDSLLSLMRRLNLSVMNFRVAETISQETINRTNFKVLCIHVDQNLAEIRQGYIFRNGETDEKNQLVSLQHLLCSVLWEVALRQPVNRDTKHQWEVKKNYKTMHISQCRQRHDGNATVENITVGDSQGRGAVYTFWGSVR